MNSREFLRRSLFVVSVWLCSALPATAQGVGSIGGTVMDTTGAVLPGATVTLSSAQGTVGSNQEATSDARGFMACPYGFVFGSIGSGSASTSYTEFCGPSTVMSSR